MARPDLCHVTLQIIQVKVVFISTSMRYAVKFLIIARKLFIERILKMQLSLVGDALIEGNLAFNVLASKDIN